MAKSHASLYLVLLGAGLALLLNGCGSGGSEAGGPSLKADPFSRNTGTVAQALDLCNALDGVDAPAGKEYLQLISSENGPVYYLNALEIPANLLDFYPLAQTAASTRGPAGGTGPLMAKNEITIAALARALARGSSAARGDGRDNIPIDFIGENGVHWVGTYSYTTVGTVVTSILDVTGTLDDLTVEIHIQSDAGSSLSENNSTTDYTFTYSFQITGTINDVIAGSSTIDLTATGSGNGGDTVIFSPLSSSGNQHEQTRYQIAVNNRITYRSITSLDHSYTTTDGSDYDYTLEYSADAWLFAADGYWVHASVNIDDTDTDSTYSFDAEASDGYTLTFDGAAGLLADKQGVILANLNFDNDEDAIKVNFTVNMIWLGAPNFVYIYLQME